MKPVIAIVATGLLALSNFAYAGADAKPSASVGCEGGCSWGAEQTARTPELVKTAQASAPEPETKPGG